METKRTLEDVKKEYGEASFKLGQTVYQIKMLERDIELFTTQLQDLNFEALKIQEEAKKAAEEGEKKDA